MISISSKRTADSSDVCPIICARTIRPHSPIMFGTKRHWAMLVLLVVAFRTFDVSMNVLEDPAKIAATLVGGGELSKMVAMESTVPANRAKRPVLWHDMTPGQQNESLADVMPYLAHHASILRQKGGYKGNCTTTKFGKGWGAHSLCDIPPAKDTPCTFVSFGISNDYSFDVDMAERWNCRGFASDPTIVHPSQLHPLVTFHNIAAKTLYPNEQKTKDKREWWIASMPALRKFLNLSHINFLKMDCEGCEYSLARDILTEDPDFLHHVDQLSLEVHVSKEWVKTQETLYYFGKLFQLLEEAGLKLQATLVASCNRFHERMGCMKEIQDIGYPCGNRRSCHDYLFARV